MPTLIPDRKSEKDFFQQSTFLGTGRNRITAVLAPLAVVAVLSWHGSGPLLLPALSLVLLCVGFGLAAAACMSSTRRETLLDVAGALVLLGCAAAMLTDTQEALGAYEGLTALLGDKLTTR